MRQVLFKCRSKSRSKSKYRKDDAEVLQIGQPGGCTSWGDAPPAWIRGSLPIVIPRTGRGRGRMLSFSFVNGRVRRDCCALFYPADLPVIDMPVDRDGSSGCPRRQVLTAGILSRRLSVIRSRMAKTHPAVPRAASRSVPKIKTFRNASIHIFVYVLVYTKNQGAGNLSGDSNVRPVTAFF